MRVQFSLFGRISYLLFLSAEDEKQKMIKEQTGAELGQTKLKLRFGFASVSVI